MTQQGFFRWVLVGLVGIVTALAIASGSLIRALLITLSATIKAGLATWNLTLDLLSVLLVVVIVAGLLVPLEALGWWAGWYGDEIDTNIDPGRLEEPIPANVQVRKYLVYLDGISQAQYQYIPEVERFLGELAAVLPDDIVIIRGLMPYSAFNKPLTEDRMLSFFWRFADRFQMEPSAGIIGALIGATINVRNILIVSVSADQRYGPIYNQSIAQTIYNSVIYHGYQHGSRVPITLLGYSGGGQMALGAAPYLKRSLKAPLDVISLSGVLSGNHNILELEHLYHVVGDKDLVEKEGPIMFPRRWGVMFLSYWNRAKRRGKISFISLGPVGHNAASGPYSTSAHLPDGRTHLEHTVEVVSGLIEGTSALVKAETAHKLSNYDRYYEADFNQPAYYPLNQSVDPTLYRPIAPWMGRLILPQKQERWHVKGVWFEVHHAPPAFQQLIGSVLSLRWSHQPETQAFVRVVTKDVHFSSDTIYSQQQGVVHPDRLNHWQQVDPLESLAGAHPHDDVIVALWGEVRVTGMGDDIGRELQIDHTPIQISGRYYALVKVLEPIDHETSPPERFRVVHFNRELRQFVGKEEIIRFPHVVFAKLYGSYPSTTNGLEKSFQNDTGWYVYGARDATGMFVVQAIAPRALLRLQPDEFIVGKTASWNYLRNDAWQVEGQKGRTKSVLMVPHEPEGESSLQDAIADWQEGDRALVLHTYGGIGGKCKEPAASTPIFFGHFAYGVATVVREPLANELMFDITYYQVYTHNVDGIISGLLAWNRFIGDRQVGWLGTRPVCDLLIKLPAFTGAFDVYGQPYSVLDVLLNQLEMMTARYRIGDGTGGTYVGAAHNCSRDSNQALYAALKRVRDARQADPQFEQELQDDPGEAERFEQLDSLTKNIRRKLLPFGSARADWRTGDTMLGISPEEQFWTGILMGLRSWRTLLPRVASEAIAKQFIDQGASVWILRTNQVGGYDPDIEPIAPTPFGW
ncbi:putative protease of the Abi (CAAX) family [Leptolyngbyaceae cyanobacterium JSC-12]|nr:putative protease of the Abi (CAAX) family [Leptolyngbyaceae cyanobacterium JSC-12]